ncbi:MAG TPA: single-stranded-DNA-specific exonuclease RecJ [Candidatus Acidoferrum sp.]|nr:single-stranded-DNA-specific exonuclease RecJ [Candidatus Acidoferrum sp.]
MQLRQRSSSSVPVFTQPLHPVLQRILAVRGVASDEQLQLPLAGLLPPATLKGLDDAVALLLMMRTKRVLIVADYDADGATSCALAMVGLRQLGFAHADYLVPNRFEFGYGLTPPIVELARAKNPDVLITVDNGIASHAGIALARQYGIEVVVTDHHLPAATLPAASAIVNPNQPGCGFASKALAGVGVVFYLLLGLRKALREGGEFSDTKPEPNLASLLDLVALGTVADVVPLDDNNRCLVKHGLALIRQRRCRPGITALLEVGGRDPARCVASDLGFAAGPRLNAAGRLDDMSLGIECLLTDDPLQAATMAQQLDALNRDRKLIEQEMQDSALQQLETLTLSDEEHASLCLYDSSWHQGVIGLLASRLKDRLHCPVLVFADAGVDADGEPLVKGSARSIAGIHMRDLLDSVATHNPGLLDKFGGHAMAAGLTLAKKHFDVFAAAIDAEVRRNVDPGVLQRETWHDGELPGECLTLPFAEQLRLLMPWGQQFPEPLFLGDFTIRNQRVLAERHLKLSVTTGAAVIDAIAFQQAPLLQADARRVRLLYKLDVNEYRGERAPQLVVEHLEYL